jgi:hypothetical protein
MRSLTRRHQPEPLPNVWLGVSTEDQKWADIRIPVLADTPAAVRFISAEPLLGPIDLTAYLPRLDLPRLDWVIVGGESGPQHRPMHPDWPRSIRDQCTSTGVAFLFKQWGGRTAKAGGRELDGRTWDQYPDTIGEEVSNMTDDIDRTDELLELIAQDQRREAAISNGQHPDDPAARVYSDAVNPAGHHYSGRRRVAGGRSSLGRSVDAKLKAPAAPVKRCPGAVWLVTSLISRTMSLACEGEARPKSIRHSGEIFDTVD